MGFTDFVHRILKDLNLGAAPVQLYKALETQITQVVDAQVEDALLQTLTDEDWKVFEHYQKDHPSAPAGEAFNVMVKSRPEIQEAIEDRLVSTYVDMRAKREAVEGVLEERSKASYTELS